MPSRAPLARTDPFTSSVISTSSRRFFVRTLNDVISSLRDHGLWRLQSNMREFSGANRAVNSFVVDRRQVGQTLAAFLKQQLQLSWTQASKLIETKQVRLNGHICAEIARRLKVG